MHFFVTSSGSSGGRPRALKLDRINNVYANCGGHRGRPSSKVYNVTRYIYIYICNRKRIFFCFFFFFQEILRSAVERKDLFLLRTLRWIFKNPLSLSFLLPFRYCFVRMLHVRWERKAMIISSVKISVKSGGKGKRRGEKKNVRGNANSLIRVQKNSLCAGNWSSFEKKKAFFHFIALLIRVYESVDNHCRGFN